MNHEPIKSHILEALDSLSPKNLEELARFVDFLRFKEQPQNVQPPPTCVKLEEVWKDLPLDITDEDIRNARRELTDQVEKRLDERRKKGDYCAKGEPTRASR